MITDKSSNIISASIGNTQVVMPLTTRAPIRCVLDGGSTKKKSVPPGFGSCKPPSALFARNSCQAWSNGGNFSPTAVQGRRVASPRHMFLPLTPHDVSDAPTSIIINKHDGTPPSSPFKMKKISPTHTVLTMSTASVDSSDISYMAMSEDTKRSSFVPYVPTRSSTLVAPAVGANQDMSSLQRALWIPPRSIAVCQLLKDCRLDDQSWSSPDLSTTASRRKAVFSPPRVEQDPTRKSRIKTEMCLHFINKTTCPFGANCTYAHGEEELQLTRLVDLHEAGLVDAATYRTVPCLTFVSTGSCPFGKRCHGIHDPRVAGNVQSWLPHTETQGNTIATDINVDALHQKRLYSLLHNNPFGALFNPSENAFEDLYNQVCNNTPQACNRKLRKGAVEDHHKISIALRMRGGSNFQFKFRPQHIVFDELCMILQKRVFRLTNDEAVEIPFSMYNAHSAKDILVREIAFGPDCDSTVRGVGLWYGIAESDVTVCTPQQAKRFRWKRGLSNKKQGRNDAIMINSVASKFDYRDSFVMIRPSESDAYDLSTRMLVHRLAVLKAERIPNLCDRTIALEGLGKNRVCIEECFDGLARNWERWTWPVNEGRNKVDNSSTVPSVDANYNPTGASADIHRTAVFKIWESFASVDFLTAHEKQYNEEIDDFTLPTTEDFEAENSRLRVFKYLAEGESLCCPGGSAKVKLIHINDGYDGFEVTGMHSLQSRRCWKSLLLKQSALNDHNEWGIVSEHFQNSRSRKVLSILQSQ